MNNNPFDFQPTHTPQRSQQPPLPLGRPPLPSQSTQRDYAALGQWDDQQSHVQAPPAPSYNLQWTVPPSSEQNYNYDPQWQRPHLQNQQHPLPPVAQPPPHSRLPAVQPGHNPYQHAPLSVASPQPQLLCDLYLQTQQQEQQKRLHHTTSQDLMSAKRQRFNSPNPQVQHHAPLPPEQLQVPLSSAQNVYLSLNQKSGLEEGPRGPINGQLDDNEEGSVANRRGMRGDGGGGTREGSILRNQGEIADCGLSGSRMNENDGDWRGGDLHAPDLGGNLCGVASTQAGGRDQFSSIAEPALLPVTTQFEGARDFTINGNPIMTNIGVNTGNLTTVNYSGGTHGLEKLEKFVSFAALHDSSDQDPDRRCHPGTREYILSRLRYWIDNPNERDRIVWLHGPAGAGKSAIAQTIAHGCNQGEVAATFFFFRSDSGRNDGNRLFPTIAWQLAFSIPATKQFVIHALDKTPHLPTKGVETQFEQLVGHVFQPTNNVASQMRHLAPVIIIDGLDECSDEQLQRRILVVIGNAVKDCQVPIRFLISSRPEALIEETLDRFQQFTLRIDLATLDDANRDVEKYLVNEFSIIASNQGLPPTWPDQETIEEIVFKSSGNFILASTLIRFIGDEDYSAESQLDIVRKLKPQGTTSPFALLDELYLEVLKRPRDQDFLKTYLALLVGRSSVGGSNLHEDDATLMNVSEKELRIKLRRMRSLLEFKPFIDVYHKSFLDFLQDSSRSDQYHVNKQDSLKRYLELIVDSVVRHVSMPVEESNCHRTFRSGPKFKAIVERYPPKIVLPVDEWQEALKPLLDLQDKLLEISKPHWQPCCFTQIMRNLQLHLVILQRTSHHIAAAPASESNNNEPITEWSPAGVTETMQDIPEADLDDCLSRLLSCLQTTNSVLAVDTVIIERMSSLLAFGHTETVARVRSVTDAQKLIDIVDLLTNNESFLSRCGRDAARDLNYACSSAVMGRILDHTYILPTWFIYQGDMLKLVDGSLNERNESIEKWLTRASPNLVTRIRVMLEVARIIQYLHSMDVVNALNSSVIRPNCFALDSDRRAKVVFRGFARRVRKKENFSARDSTTNFTYESNISAFGDLFHQICFSPRNKNRPGHLVDDAKRLIERCRAKDPKSRPTMENIVKEMKTWNLT